MEITIFFIIFNTILGIVNMCLYLKTNELPVMFALSQAFLWIAVGMQIGELTFYYFR